MTGEHFVARNENDAGHVHHWYVRSRGTRTDIHALTFIYIMIIISARCLPSLSFFLNIISTSFHHFITLSLLTSHLLLSFNLLLHSFLNSLLSTLLLSFLHPSLLSTPLSSPHLSSLFFTAQCIADQRTSTRASRTLE